MLQRAVEPSRIVRGALVVAAAGVGAAAAMAPVTVAVAVAGILGAGWLLTLGSRVVRVFLIMMAVILTGYAFFNRAFAYVGVAPLFVGEAVLGLGALAFVYRIRRWQLTPIHVALLAFMGWGAMRTVPYVPVFGVDALRDGVGWLYGLYALFLGAIVLPEHFPVAVRLTRRIIPYFLAWVPVAGLIAITVGSSLPTMPGSDVPVIAFKGGDAGVLLAGVAAFILLGLYARAESRPRLPEPLVWLPWLAGAAVVSIVNRGGMLATVTASTVLLFVRQSSRWLGAAFVVAVIVVLLSALNPRVDLGGRREFSFSQFTDNIASLFGDTGSSLDGTKGFRLAWWGAIWDYTVNGPYFWDGKGYGVALAVVDGFNTTEAEVLRSPHNGHLEVLARAGVPGFVLWVLLQVLFAGAMLSGAARAMRDRRTFWVQVIGLCFVVWAAGLANASFDPYLQGPQGGIWFWSAMGLGLAATRAVREGAPEPRTATPGRATGAGPDGPAASL